MVQRMVLATGNRKKVVELESILEGLGVALVPMTDLDLPEPVEDGASFEDNALIKARAACAGSGLPALADDSGLEVDALGGAPGVHSARYAGTEHPDRQDNDDANNRRLLEDLAGEQDRAARFVCVAALALPDGRSWTERGTMEGRIVDAPQGAQGFGYDPFFVSQGESRTNAELTSQEKNARSHRGTAFRAMRVHVAEYLAAQGS
ncbi:MAG: XTP/dITP diphosphohydrolase [Glaciecola sp.]|jgi:XTP/dITP diphosphohydrolase